MLLALGGPSCGSESPSDPQLDSIAPNRVPVGQQTRAAIKGRQFRTKIHVEIDSRRAPTIERNFKVWLGSQALPSEAVSYVDESTLAIVVPPTLAVGLYDLELQTPTGQRASLSRALTVFESAMNNGGASNQVGGGMSVAGAGSSSAASAATFAVAGSSVSGSGSGAASPGPGGSAGSAHSVASGLSGFSSTMVPGGGGTLSSVGGASGALMGGSAGALPSAGSAGATLAHPTLWTEGRVLRDSCGNQLVLRGVQQILTNGVPLDNDWTGLMDQIAATGANAIRIQVNTTALSLSDIDAVLSRLATHNLVTVINPSSTSWFADASVRSMLSRYSDRLILDAYGPGYDDRPRFLNAAKAAVAQVRGYGYQVPLVVLTNNYGRDLPAALNYGAEIIAADPLHNTILGWDAYWGSSNWYQQRYSMSLTQGLVASAAAAFPIQVGLILETDPGETLDYETAMTEARANDLGWLWWDWYNPNDQTNNLSADGTSINLRTVGERVVNTHPGGFVQIASKPCIAP